MTRISPINTTNTPSSVPICEEASLSSKVALFAKNIFLSKTVWILFTIAATITLSCLTAKLNIPQENIAYIATFGVMILGSIVKVYKKEIIHENSFLDILIHNKFKPAKYMWYSKIKDNLYLGAMPLKNKNHLNELKNIAQSANKKLSVLSSTEDWELYQETPFSSPVTPQDWKDSQVDQKIIEIQDFKAPPLAELKEGADFIKNELSKNHLIYVHCKAGKGRSASIVACYLMLYENKTVDEAIKIIKDQRSFISLEDASKKQRLKEFYDTYCQRRQVSKSSWFF